MHPAPPPLPPIAMLPLLAARTALGLVWGPGCVIRHTIHDVLWGPDPGFASPCRSPPIAPARTCHGVQHHYRICHEPPLYGCGCRG